jgi:hypothetical protein
MIRAGEPCSLQAKQHAQAVTHILMCIPKAVIIVHKGALGDFLQIWPSLLALRRHFAPTPLYWAGRDAYRLWTDPLGLRPCPEQMRRAVDRLYAAGSWPRELENCRVVWFGLHTPPTEVPFPDLHFLPGIIPGRYTPPRRVYAAGLQRMGVPPCPDWHQIWRDLSPHLKPGPRTPQALVFPGAGHPAKCWPMSNYMQTASWLERNGWEPVFVLGPAERERGLEVQNFQRLHPQDLGQLQKALCGADIILGNDCGPMHLAGLLDRTGIVLFGPASPRQWGPPGLTCLRTDLPCSPCTQLGRINCRQAECMTRISVSRVKEELWRLGQDSAARRR